jgi:hypothetical protein
MSAEAYNAKILQTLEQIQRDVADIKGRVSTAPASGGGRSVEAASASDLDGPHGDPLIKFDPKAKYWTGDSYVGCRFSETTPEYLDAVSKYLGACSFMASKDAAAGKDVEKNERSAKFKSLDAARAAGWAARLRAGFKPAAPAAGGYEPYDPHTGEVGADYAADAPF